MRLDASHRDCALLQRIEDALYESAGSREKFEQDIPELFRQAIDEVIDPARSKRFTIDEIEKTEKTYLGTKIEILLHNYFGFDRGKHLDLIIDGVEVDVKNTISDAASGWAIPSEAIGHPCILVRADESVARCSFGLIVIREEILNPGRNRDGKTTIKASELKNVHWLLRDSKYPPNFWLGLRPEVRMEIMRPRGATNRVATLFRRHMEQPISRRLIEALGHQLDPLKRLRKNGGARDQLAREGIAILSGQKHTALIAELYLPKCGRDEFISFKPSRPEDVDRLKELKEIK